MSDSRDDDEAYIMDSVAGLNKMMLPFATDLAQVDFFGIGLGRYLILALFPAGAMLFLWLAYVAEMHSFWNLLCIELSSGFLFFALAPSVVFLGRTYRWQVPLVGVLIAGPLLSVAYSCENLFSGASQHACEFARAVLIEYAIALLLVIGLEIAMAPWLKGLEAKYAQARDNLDRYKKEREAYEAEAAP